ncbi:MAG: hypothetical protein AMXMBFR55_33010 [Gemmatimonadota bacterium]
MSYGYEGQLWGIANYIDGTLLPRERARLAAWESNARAAGLYEGTVIVSVLQPWNTWDQGMADLAAIVIPNELKRVQAGGPDGDIKAFQWTSPPPLPDVGALLQQQGGALIGAQQHTAALSPVAPPAPVELPAAVLADPTPALQSLVNNMAPEARPGATPQGAPLDPLGSAGVLGDAPQSGSLGASGNSGAPSLSSPAGPADPLDAGASVGASLATLDGWPPWMWLAVLVGAAVVFGRR